MPVKTLVVLAEALRDYVQRHTAAPIEVALVHVARQEHVSLSRMQYALTYAEAEGWLESESAKLSLV